MSSKSDFESMKEQIIGLVNADDETAGAMLLVGRTDSEKGYITKKQAYGSDLALINLQIASLAATMGRLSKDKDMEAQLAFLAAVIADLKKRYSRALVTESADKDASNG